MSHWGTIFKGELLDPTTLIGAFLWALVFLLVAAVATRALRTAVQQVLKRDEYGLIDRTAVAFLTQVGQIMIYLVSLIFYAHTIPGLRGLGGGLLTSVSVVSIVVGVAAQNTLGNLIAGFSLLLYRPFQVGDLLQVRAPSGLESGAVETLTLGYTILKTGDNRRLVLPNSVMASQGMVNFTTRDPRIIAGVPISVGPEVDVDKARRVLVELAQVHPSVQSIVGCPVTQLADSKTVLTLSVWCADAATAQVVQCDLYEQVKKRFGREDIEIPFPYTNVVLRDTRRKSDAS